MSILFEAVEPMSQVVHHFNRFDEDAVDRLNHKYSTIIFCILAIVVTTNQYVGEIIKCWSPAQFPESWIEYTNSICWISNTYYVPISESNILSAPRKEIVYYQWVALVLFLQAFMFYLPCVHWAVLSRSIGMDINKVVQTLRQIEHINPENRDKSTKFLIKHLDRSLDYTREIRTGRCAEFKQKMAACGCFCGKRYGNFLITVYIVTKILYLGDVVLQLYMMNHFLGTDYVFYGVDVLRDLSSTGDYKESRRFPRVTLCDFQVRSIARTQPYTVQCTLPVNLFNEKIFIFVWFWLVFLVVINCLSTVYWLWIAFTTNRRAYIKTYLRVFNKYDKYKDHQKLNEFCNVYLRQDGHFILRIIAKNTNEVVVSELITALWDTFSTKYEKKQKKYNV